MAKHLPPGRQALSRKEGLEKGKRGWEGSHEEAEGAQELFGSLSGGEQGKGKRN